MQSRRASAWLMLRHSLTLAIIEGGLVLTYYSIVSVTSSPATVGLGIAGSQGVVLGVSVGAETSYAVSIDGECYMIDATDLIDTGRRSDPARHFSGETLAVPPQQYGGESTPG